MRLCAQRTASAGVTTPIYFVSFSISSCIWAGLIFESLATPLSTGQGTMLLATTRENATRNVVEKIDLEIAALLDAFIIFQRGCVSKSKCISKRVGVRVGRCVNARQPSKLLISQTRKHRNRRV